MIETDWIYGFVGGLMIGAAAFVYLLVNGRIMGASGILGGLIDRSDWKYLNERVSFIIGLVAVPAIIGLIYGMPDTRITGNYVLIIVGGVLVGLGTRMANGCTSGHGVCGISRFSMRGIAATIFYLLGGGVTVLLFKNIWGII